MKFEHELREERTNDKNENFSILGWRDAYREAEKIIYRERMQKNGRRCHWII